MTRMVGAVALWLAILLLLYSVAIRPNRHPLLIDAAMPAGGDWCDVLPGPPLIEPPRGPYDHQLWKRRRGDEA